MKWSKKNEITFEEMNIGVAEFIRSIREKKNWSIRKLAKEAEVSFEVVRKIENGINKSYESINVCNENYYKILIALDSSLHQMYSYIYKK